VLEGTNDRLLRGWGSYLRRLFMKGVRKLVNGALFVVQKLSR